MNASIIDQNLGNCLVRAQPAPAQAQDRVVDGMAADEIQAAPKYRREQVAEQFGGDVELVR